MYDVDEVISQVPDVCRELEDCWVSALIVVSTMRKRNYKPLFLNSYMYYDSSLRYENLQGFEKIIRKNIAIAEADRHDFEEDVEIECEFLKEFLGMNCTGKASSGDDAEKYAKRMIAGKASCILWMDTYLVPWNPMYKKIHFQHCTTIIEYGARECLVYDALNSGNECFTVPTKELFNMTNYVSVICDCHSIIGQSDEQKQVPYFVDKYMFRYNGIKKYIGAIQLFLRDLKDCSSAIIEDMEGQNEDIVKLMMRIFVNQYQKCMKQYDIFDRSGRISEEDMIIFEELNNTWKSCGSLFAKICFLSGEKRAKKFEDLCGKVSCIVELLGRIQTNREMEMAGNM